MKNVTSRQRDALDRLPRADITVRWADDRGTASMIKGPLGQVDPELDPEEIIRQVLDGYRDLLGPADDTQDYMVTEVMPAKAGGQRVKAAQVHDGIPIYGASLLAFAESEQGIYRVQNGFYRDIHVTAEQTIGDEDLVTLLRERLYEDEGASAFEAQWREGVAADSEPAALFPLTVKPQLYLFPIEEGFHPAYNVWAYQPVKLQGIDGRVRQEIELVELMVDAATGSIIWEETALEGALTDETRDGLSTLQDDHGNLFSRILNTVLKDGTEHLLMNRSHTTPHIITYHGQGTSNSTTLKNQLKNGDDISTDPDGHWDSTTTSCSAAVRENAQQPEVDAHFHAEQAFQFYEDLGWTGFDNGGWGDNCPVSAIAHIGMDANAFFNKYSVYDSTLGGWKWYGYIAFYDGLCDALGNLSYDFIAGDPVIFAHEYQHAITFFGASKANGDPGHLYGDMWLGAIREGYSDTFACLRYGLYANPPAWPIGVRRMGDPFRRIDFPRSTDTRHGDGYCDHFDDRSGARDKYFHSTILSHAAFLLGEGGVHQRTSRPAEFIPVEGIGRTRAAEIYLYALTQYFSGIPVNAGSGVLIEAANLLLDAAEDIGGTDRSEEYVMTRRALYAVGLYPYDSSYNPLPYGGEACMLPMTYLWRHSQPFIGFPEHWQQSPDLFINNGKGQRLSVEVGRVNRLYARVRNIGDEELRDIRVTFKYFRRGMDMAQPCLSIDGKELMLEIAELPAGSPNIADPNRPPLDQGVDWFVDKTIVTKYPEFPRDDVIVWAEIHCTAKNHDNDVNYGASSQFGLRMEPLVVANPKNVNFGRVHVNSTKYTVVEFINLGSYSCTIERVQLLELLGRNFRLGPRGFIVPFRLGPGKSFKLPVLTKPTRTGSHRASVTIVYSHKGNRHNTVMKLRVEGI